MESNFKENILKLYHEATADEWHDGMTWYERANAYAREISDGFTYRSCGVIAALSPQTSWEVNKDAALKFIFWGTCSVQSEANILKAKKIWTGEGDPLDVLGGNKTRSFYRNLAFPNTPSSVTIDRHAVNIAYGRLLPDKERIRVFRVKGGYEDLEAAYKEAAFDVGVLPHQMQAVTWVRFRNLRGDLHNAQV